jgi:hypothetical protein
MSQSDGTVIHIDKQQYRVLASSMTGSQLRAVPPAPIGPDLDLYEEVPGGEDVLIQNDVTYELKNGMHFFTAPSNINPG